MSAEKPKAKHSPDVIILVDPVQDYEESLTVLGVYGSIGAAKQALPRLRRLPYPGVYAYSPNRISEAQRWCGDQHLETWTFRPGSGWSGPIASEGVRD